MKRRTARQKRYESYLLRLWRDSSYTPWHLSLQSTKTERTYHFASIDALFVFLEQQIEEQQIEELQLEEQHSEKLPDTSDQPTE